MLPNGSHYPCPGPEEFIIDLKSKSQNQIISTTEPVIVKVPFHIVIQTSRDDDLLIVSLLSYNCGYY